MSEMTNKVTTKHEIRGEVQITKVYPELENLTVTPTKQVQSFNHPDSYGYNNVVVKAIDCKTLNVVPKKENQAFDGMYDKVNVSAINCETLNITPKQENQVFNGMYDKVNVNAIQADTLKVTPSKSEQSFKGLYEQVNVEAIQGDTLNITPKDQEQSFKGLYETVNVGAIVTEEVTINPDFSKQNTVVATATTGKYLKKATINKDTNLVPENILEGVNIYGVGGTATSGIDTSDATATAEDIAKDKTAYVNGEKVVGTLEVSGGDTDLNVKIDLASLVNGTSITTSMSNSTYRDYFINKVDFTNTDLSTKPNMESLFSSSYGLTEVVGLDAIYVTNMNSLFKSCSKLEKVEIYNTQNVTNMYQMFSGCSTLKEIPELDCSSCINTYGMFGSCSALESLGGLKNLGKAFTQASASNSNYRVNLSQSKNLTHESLMNIINGLYDLNLTYDVANGGTLYTQTLSLGSTNLAKLTAEEIAIATAKGWTVS